jgi:hypothetical protein
MTPSLQILLAAVAFLSVVIFAVEVVARTVLPDDEGEQRRVH